VNFSPYLRVSKQLANALVISNSGLQQLKEREETAPFSRD
jgi:hypothetical protein